MPRSIAGSKRAGMPGSKAGRVAWGLLAGSHKRQKPEDETTRQRTAQRQKAEAANGPSQGFQDARRRPKLLFAHSWIRQKNVEIDGNDEGPDPDSDIYAEVGAATCASPEG